ncbi:copper homeostasis protein CutC [Thalassospira lucentensis]|uniref:copper homeostasis protein CutC n=1 Tax=Thalassospira lucentensis TaxID=168935 RepID=UPI003D29D3DD
MRSTNKDKQAHAPLLEVCVESFTDAMRAVEAGADRIEYCSALALGGLTPTPGALARLNDIPAPCMVMIRPRPGGFWYEPEDVAIMKREIAIARDSGAAGVVFGACDRNAHLDVSVLSDLMSDCAGLQTTLHRVFDDVPDQRYALEQAIEIGFDRILTSGGKPEAKSGAKQIAALIKDAAGRIVILPGAGVSAENATEILEVTGATELHASCKAVMIDMLNHGRTCVDVVRVSMLHNVMNGCADGRLR